MPNPTTRLSPERIEEINKKIILPAAIRTAETAKRRDQISQPASPSSTESSPVAMTPLSPFTDGAIRSNFASNSNQEKINTSILDKEIPEAEGLATTWLGKELSLDPNKADDLEKINTVKNHYSQTASEDLISGLAGMAMPDNYLPDVMLGQGPIGEFQPRISTYHRDARAETKFERLEGPPERFLIKTTSVMGFQLEFPNHPELDLVCVVPGTATFTSEFISGQADQPDGFYFVDSEHKSDELIGQIIEEKKFNKVEFGEIILDAVAEKLKNDPEKTPQQKARILIETAKKVNPAGMVNAKGEPAAIFCKSLAGLDLRGIQFDDSIPVDGTTDLEGALLDKAQIKWLKNNGLDDLIKPKKEITFENENIHYEIREVGSLLKINKQKFTAAFKEQYKIVYNQSPNAFQEMWIDRFKKGDDELLSSALEYAKKNPTSRTAKAIGQTYYALYYQALKEAAENGKSSIPEHEIKKLQAIQKHFNLSNADCISAIFPALEDEETKADIKRYSEKIEEIMNVIPTMRLKDLKLNYDDTVIIRENLGKKVIPERVERMIISDMRTNEPFKMVLNIDDSTLSNFFKDITRLNFSVRNENNEEIDFKSYISSYVKTLSKADLLKLLAISEDDIDRLAKDETHKPTQELGIAIRDWETTSNEERATILFNLCNAAAQKLEGIYAFIPLKKSDSSKLALAARTDIAKTWLSQSLGVKKENVKLKELISATNQPLIAATDQLLKSKNPTLVTEMENAKTPIIFTQNKLTFYKRGENIGAEVTNSVEISADFNRRDANNKRVIEKIPLGKATYQFELQRKRPDEAQFKLTDDPVKIQGTRLEKLLHGEKPPASFRTNVLMRHKVQLSNAEDTTKTFNRNHLGSPKNYTAGRQSFSDYQSENLGKKIEEEIPGVATTWMTQNNIPEEHAKSIQAHFEATLAAAPALTFETVTPGFSATFSAAAIPLNRIFSFSEATCTISSDKEITTYQSKTAITLKSTDPEVSLGNMTAIFNVTEAGLELTKIKFDNPRLQDLFNGNNPDGEYQKQFDILKHAIEDHEKKHGDKVSSFDRQSNINLLVSFFSEIHDKNKDARLNLDLSNLNASHCDFHELDFSHANLSNSNLSNSNLSNSNLSNSNISGTDFSNSLVTRCNFSGCTLDNETTFSGCNVRDAIFKGNFTYTQVDKKGDQIASMVIDSETLYKAFEKEYEKSLSSSNHTWRGFLDRIEGGITSKNPVGNRLLMAMQYAKQQDPKDPAVAQALNQAYYNCYIAIVRENLKTCPDTEKRTHVETLLKLATHLGVAKDLSKLNLTGADLSGIDLSNVNLQKTKLDKATLTGITIDPRTNLKECTFSGVKMDSLKKQQFNKDGSVSSSVNQSTTQWYNSFQQAYYDKRGGSEFKFFSTDYVKSLNNSGRSDAEKLLQVEQHKQDTAKLGGKNRTTEALEAAYTNAITKSQKSQSITPNVVAVIQRTIQSRLDTKLAGRDLSNTDLSKWNLRGADLRGTDLRGTDLSNAIFDHTTKLDSTTKIDIKTKLVNVNFTTDQLNALMLSSVNTADAEKPAVKMTPEAILKSIFDTMLNPTPGFTEAQKLTESFLLLTDFFLLLQREHNEINPESGADTLVAHSVYLLQKALDGQPKENQGKILRQLTQFSDEKDIVMKLINTAQAEKSGFAYYQTHIESVSKAIQNPQLKNAYTPPENMEIFWKSDAHNEALYLHNLQALSSSERGKSASNSMKDFFDAKVETPSTQTPKLGM